MDSHPLHLFQFPNVPGTPSDLASASPLSPYDGRGSRRSISSRSSSYGYQPVKQFEVCFTFFLTPIHLVLFSLPACPTLNHIIIVIPSLLVGAREALWDGGVAFRIGSRESGPSSSAPHKCGLSAPRHLAFFVSFPLGIAAPLSGHVSPFVTSSLVVQASLLSASLSAFSHPSCTYGPLPTLSLFSQPTATAAPSDQLLPLRLDFDDILNILYRIGFSSTANSITPAFPVDLPDEQHQVRTQVRVALEHAFQEDGASLW
ncbi:hypothetical protein CSAL01_09911 [Colletotrichum salicis]|uniref:Uncharacterized protein n=1 Tax=Colletotrichum salicis TaxID=1209931 RepID=A0A135UGD1_9PEZI|nr:hypothetical protein CSAL01_09911 [Colletotrichum salicis]